MKKEKVELGLQEVSDKIELALRDARGLLAHQRRLAFVLSLGASLLLELYLQKQQVFKQGSQINHLWFKRKKETVLELLQRQITTPLHSIEHIHAIVDLIIKIEEKRDDLAYGAPTTEKILQKKIDLFFELKKVTSC